MNKRAVRYLMEMWLVLQMSRVGLYCTRCITRDTRALTNEERLALWRERLRAWNEDQEVA